MHRKVYYLPIYAYLPERSGLRQEEVDRGLNFNNYRGEYLSFHLSKGAPAFSPNNMRLGVAGGRLVSSKAVENPGKKNKKKYIQKKVEVEREQKKQKVREE